MFGIEYKTCMYTCSYMILLCSILDICVCSPYRLTQIETPPTFGVHLSLLVHVRWVLRHDQQIYPLISLYQVPPSIPLEIQSNSSCLGNCHALRMGAWLGTKFRW